MITQGYLDASKFAQDMAIEDNSIIIADDGDGTLHEVVNGIILRQNKRKIPITFVPNGPGNDTCRSIGANSVQQAIDYIYKGDTLKIDLNRIFIDAAESFE